MAAQDSPNVTELDGRYEIRRAWASDHRAIAEFIDRHWRKGHIFAHSKELMDWQHFDRHRRQYNFMLGIERESGQLHGILGFIPLSQFDDRMPESRLCWMAIWKVMELARGYKLGRHLMSFLETSLKPEVISTVAASSMTLPMYQARGFLTGTLGHYYLLNPLKAPYKLVSGARHGIGVSKEIRRDQNKSLIVLSGEDLEQYADIFSSQGELPRKSPEYLLNRYLRHPIYKYQVYGIRESGRTCGLIVTRICQNEEARAIRIVDFTGPSSVLQGLGGEWQSLLESQDSEYMDFYNAGIDDEDLRLSGFVRRVAGDGIVIPNYFEPFLMQNVEIDYAIRLPTGRTYRIVKGDSDQDRPNVIANLAR